MKRRTEILIEIEREIVITQRRNGPTWCIACGKQVHMLMANEAAQLIKTDESVIHRLAESGELHYAATSEGMLLICPDSLQVLQSDGRVRLSEQLLITDGDT